MLVIIVALYTSFAVTLDNNMSHNLVPVLSMPTLAHVHFDLHHVSQMGSPIDGCRTLDIPLSRDRD